MRAISEKVRCSDDSARANGECVASTAVSSAILLQRTYRTAGSLVAAASLGVSKSLSGVREQQKEEVEGPSVEIR
jgi:hypothetical protein